MQHYFLHSSNSRRHYRSYKFLVCCAVLFPSIASAIIMRHDVNPDEYRLDEIEYQSSIAIDGCSAALIEPSWILTAAHCIKHFYPVGTKLQINDESIAVEKTFSHPEFDPEKTNLHDIALIKLSEPSFGTVPSPLYSGNDELGQIGKITGFGFVGNGEEGVLQDWFPNPLHGADNEIAESSAYLLRVRFDSPDEINSLPLEGVSGAGDSGAPLFINKDGTRYIAGVGSFGGIYYGKFDNFVRVSQELPWLTQVMGEDYSGEYTGPSYDELQSQQALTEDDQSSGGSFGKYITFGMFFVSIFRRLIANSKK